MPLLFLKQLVQNGLVEKRESDISNIFKVLDANNSYTIAESLPEVSHKSSLVYSKRVHSK